MSKTCKYCGSHLNDDDSFCQKCGAVADDGIAKPSASAQEFNQNNVGVNNNQNVNSGKVNGVAIASLVCSIVGLFFAAVILGTLGICLSISAKKHIKAFPGEGGRGIATAGLVIGIIDVSLWAINIVAGISILANFHNIRSV